MKTLWDGIALDVRVLWELLFIGADAHTEFQLETAEEAEMRLEQAVHSAARLAGRTAGIAPQPLSSYLPLENALKTECCCFKIVKAVSFNLITG